MFKSKIIYIFFISNQNLSMIFLKKQLENKLNVTYVFWEVRDSKIKNLLKKILKLVLFLIKPKPSFGWFLPRQ